MKNNLGFILLIFFGVASRLLPHLPNFTPVSALILVGAAYLSPKKALTLPLLIMAVSDLWLGFYPISAWVYGSFALIVALSLMGKKYLSVKTVGLYSLAGSGLFFIVSNFGVWVSGSMYQHSLAGLMECYVMALPFLRNTVLGDLFFSVVLFQICNLLVASHRPVIKNAYAIR